MTRRFRTFLSLLLVLLALVLGSQVISRFQSGELEANLLRVQGGSELSATTLQDDLKLEVGDFIPVYHFKLQALQPYTLRYLGLNVEGSGLDEHILGDARRWKLYMDGESRTLVGEGETFNGNVLRIRMFSSSTSAYFLNAGTTRFWVTAPIDFEGDAELNVALASQDWLIRPGHFEGPWLNTDGVLYEDFVSGLPAEPLELQVDF